MSGPTTKWQMITSSAESQSAAGFDPAEISAQLSGNQHTMECAQCGHVTMIMAVNIAAKDALRAEFDGDADALEKAITHLGNSIRNAANGNRASMLTALAGGSA